MKRSFVYRFTFFFLISAVMFRLMGHRVVYSFFVLPWRSPLPETDSGAKILYAQLSACVLPLSLSCQVSKLFHRSNKGILVHYCFHSFVHSLYVCSFVHPSHAGSCVRRAWEGFSAHLAQRLPQTHDSAGPGACPDPLRCHQSMVRADAEGC